MQKKIWKLCFAPKKKNIRKLIYSYEENNYFDTINNVDIVKQNIVKQNIEKQTVEKQTEFNIHQRINDMS